MRLKRTAIWGGSATLTITGIVLALWFAFAADPAQGQDDLLTVDQAKTRGLAEARAAGLMGDPTSVNATLTNLEDYVRVSSFGTGSLGTDASEFGLHPDRAVWAVAFVGAVKMTLPSSGGKTYDNITFALDARTGERIMVNAYTDGKTPPYQ